MAEKLYTQADLEALLREEREKFRELSNAISQHTA
ncbi:hypothetical protein LCGC14_2198230, partial [marine sediment metagenome]